MKARGLNLVLVLLGLATLVRAGSGLDQARLFDWIYPSEPAYADLKRVAKALGRDGWLVGRMDRGETLPQASARELAQDLIADPRTREADRQILSKALGSEASSFIMTGPMGAEIARLEESMAGFNERMNELEASRALNQYNRQSFPGLTANMRSAVLNSGGSGLLMGYNQTYLEAGLMVRFNGQSDAGAFNYNLEGRLTPADQGAGGVIQHKFLPGTWTVGISGMGFTINPLGLSLDMGVGNELDFGPLVLSEFQRPRAANDFYVNYQNDYEGTPAISTNDLQLGYPTGPKWMPNEIILKRQGTADYWPFTLMEAFYSFNEGFYKSYAQANEKRNFMGAHFKTELGFLSSIADHWFVNGGVVYAQNDEDLLHVASPQTVFQYVLPLKTLTWGVDTAIQLPTETEIKMSYASNNEHGAVPAGGTAGYTFSLTAAAKLDGYVPGKTIRGYSWDRSSEAYIGILQQQLGLLTIAVEGSHIDPFYTPPVAAIGSLIANGALPGTGGAGNTQSLTPWRNSPEPAGSVGPGDTAIVNGTQHLKLGTNLANATGLMANTNKYVLQAQTSISWINLAAFGGSASQILPTGPWIRTSPTFEVGVIGWRLWDELGNVYNPPSAPVAPCPAGPAHGTTVERQDCFNRPTDGSATDPRTGSFYNAHWQALASTSYQSIEFYLLLSERGLGDRVMAKDSVKYINYVAGNLRLDLQTLFSRLLPFTIKVAGQVAEVAPQSGFPNFGDPAKVGDPTMAFMTQSYLTGFAQYGLTNIISVLGFYGMENWRSDHSFYPLNIHIKEYGAGFDMDLATFLTGLKLFGRSKILYLDDSNIASRAFNTWEASLGTRLDF